MHRFIVRGVLYFSWRFWIQKKFTRSTVNVFIIFSSFETKLPEIFENLNETFQAVKTRMKAEQFRVTTFLNYYIMPVSFNLDPFHVDNIVVTHVDTNREIFCDAVRGWDRNDVAQTISGHQLHTAR